MIFPFFKPSSVVFTAQVFTGGSVAEPRSEGPELTGWSEHIDLQWLSPFSSYMGVSKNRGTKPKMDGL